MRREREWDRVAAFFRATRGDPDTYEIDERTWIDLGLNGVFDATDRTLSAVGEHVFYARLRRPTLTQEAFAARGALADALGRDPQALAVVRRELAVLGSEGGEGLLDLLWHGNSGASYSVWFCRAAALLPVAMIAVAVLVSVIAGAMGLVGTLLLNMWLHGRVRLASEGQMQSTRYLSRLLRTVEKFGRAPEILRTERELFLRLGRALRVVRRKLLVQRVLTLNLVDEVVGTLNVLFLFEAMTYLSILRDITRLRLQLQQAFVAIGDHDCAQAFVTLRAEHRDWAIPAFTVGSPRFVVEDLVHPALAHPVSNSTSIDGGGLVVTGSNMSGKSTFLRAVGISAVLAQSLGLVPGRGYTAEFLRVRTVMTASDDITERRSYYMDEALAVLSAAEKAVGGPPLLVIFDELFRGTNSSERVAAGVGVVRWIAGRGDIVLVATHDLEVAQLLEGALVNAHFQDRIQGEQIMFDYHLRPGRADRSNALDILAHLGYPASVVEDARRIVVSSGKNRAPELGPTTGPQSEELSLAKRT